MSKTAAIVLAAGKGTRMGGKSKKQFLDLEGKPILLHALEPFIQSDLIDQVVVVAAKEDHAYLEELFAQAGLQGVISPLVEGGKERQDSVYEGLRSLRSDMDWVVVHDGARPLLTQGLLEKCVTLAKEKGSAVAAVRVKDTIKMADGDGKVMTTPKRDMLWAVQTPQVFRRRELLDAHLNAQEGWLVGTDDASLLEMAAYPVYLTDGDYENIKVTTPEDLELARLIIQRRTDHAGRNGL